MSRIGRTARRRSRAGSRSAATDSALRWPRGPRASIRSASRRDAGRDRREGRSRVKRPSESQAAQVAARSVAHAGRQPGQRVSRGLHEEARDRGRRLPRRGQGQEPGPAARLFAPDRVSDPEGDHDRSAESPTQIAVSGIDKQQVGQVAAEIRGFRPPEPYKGKGVRYEGESRPPEGRQDRRQVMRRRGARS